MTTARPRLRVAFIGKGGSGKSAICGTVCRLLARRGWPVLALDVDTVPGLAISLGASQARARLPLGLAHVVEDDRGRRWELVKSARPARVIDRYGVVVADGVRLLELGKLPEGVRAETSMAFRYVVNGFRRPGWATVADLAAGTRQPIFGWSDFATLRIAVAEPTAKGLMTVRRLSAKATHLVVNKVREPADMDRVRRMVDLPVIAAVPYDHAVAEAEIRGLAPIDGAAGSEAVQVLSQLTSWIEESG